MLIVVLTFAVVFICRDVQVLMTRDRKALAARFALYAALILAAVAIVAWLGYARPAIVSAWNRRGFALAAVLIQLAELGLALTLRKWENGKHRWIGCVLPCPAFLVVIIALSSEIRYAVVRLDAVAAAEIVTLCWLGLVGTITLLFSETDDRRCSKEGSEDRQFVDDFALMTSCTALIFVPYGLF